MDKYQKEWEDTIKWAVKETKKVTERLKNTGRMPRGLDGTDEDYKYIHDEVDRRRKDIQERAKRGE